MALLLRCIRQNGKRQILLKRKHLSRKGRVLPFFASYDSVSDKNGEYAMRGAIFVRIIW